MHQVQNIQILRVKTKLITIRPIDGRDEPNQCRICLSGQEEDNKLISPCCCTGSVQYIHTKCFNQWIAKKYEDPLEHEAVIGEEGIKCEICKERYVYSFQLKRQCSSWEVFKRKVTARKFLFVATLLFILVDLVLLSVMANYAMRDRLDPEFDLSQLRFFLVYGALAFAFLSLLYGLHQLAKHFLFHKSFVLTPFNRNEHTMIKVRRIASADSTYIDGTMHQSHMRMENSGQLGNTL